MTLTFGHRMLSVVALVAACRCSTSGGSKHTGTAGASAGKGGSDMLGSGGAGSGGAGTGGMDAGEAGSGGAGPIGGVGSGGAGGGGTTGNGGAGRGGASGSGGAGRGGASGRGGSSAGSGGSSAGRGGSSAGSGGSSAGRGGTGAGTSTLRQPPIVEYAIDEAASGQTPTALKDARPNPLDLPITYVGTTPAFAEDTTGRSLSFPAGDIKRAGAFSPALDTGNKLFDAINGATKATLEVVADVDWKNNPAYIFQIFGLSQEDGEDDGFMLWRWNYGTNDDHLEASFTSPTPYPNGYYKRSANMAAVSAGVHIFHVVLDTTAANAADRLRIYLDGARMASTTPNEGGHDIPTNTTVHLSRPNMSHGTITGTNHYQAVSLGGYVNYYAGTGGFRGKIYYAAIHGDALTDAEIAGAPARVLNRP